MSSISATLIGLRDRREIIRKGERELLEAKVRYEHLRTMMPNVNHMLIGLDRRLSVATDMIELTPAEERAIEKKREFRLLKTFIENKTNSISTHTRLFDTDVNALLDSI